jgi:hypothetical protein
MSQCARCTVVIANEGEQDTTVEDNHCSEKGKETRGRLHIAGITIGGEPARRARLRSNRRGWDAGAESTPSWKAVVHPIVSRHNVRGLVVIVYVVAYPPQIACSRDQVSASLGSVPFRMAHRLRMNIHMRPKLVGVHLSNLSLLQGLVVSTSFRSNAGSPPYGHLRPGISPTCLGISPTCLGISPTLLWKI